MGCPCLSPPKSGFPSEFLGPADKGAGPQPFTGTTCHAASQHTVTAHPSHPSWGALRGLAAPLKSNPNPSLSARPRRPVRFALGLLPDCLQWLLSPLPCSSCHCLSPLPALPFPLPNPFSPFPGLSGSSLPSHAEPTCPFLEGIFPAALLERPPPPPCPPASRRSSTEPYPKLPSLHICYLTTWLPY